MVVVSHHGCATRRANHCCHREDTFREWWTGYVGDDFRIFRIEHLGIAMRKAEAMVEAVYYVSLVLVVAAVVADRATWLVSLVDVVAGSSGCKGAPW